MASTKPQRRAEKALKKARTQKKKFPELLDRIVDTSDVILQVLDSRFIEETRNKEVEALIKRKNKKILYVLNKSDLVKKAKLKGLKQVTPYALVSATKRKGGKELRDKIKYLAKTVKSDSKERISVGVIGYPNTGKSSIINLLIGKKSAKTGSTAGFTKGLQKLKLTKDIVLVDSPGVIPRKEYSSIDEEKISQHAIIGARDSNKIKNPELTVAHLIKSRKPLFEKHYKIRFKDAEDFLEKLGKKKNIFKKGGIVNEDKVARLVVREWQAGKIV